MREGVKQTYRRSVSPEDDTRSIVNVTILFNEREAAPEQSHPPLMERPFMAR